ncbi:MAG: lactonase family protein [Clostridia bacterium]|nr:lactonase family protein [Clostridia bacterium]
MLCYIGSYTRLGGPGVAVVREENGHLELLNTDTSIKDPIFATLSADDSVLYVTGADPSTGDGVAATYAVEGDHIRLTSMVPTHGSDVCHATLSADERFLYVANYATGCITAFPTVDGKLLPDIQHIVHEGSGPSLPRQDAAHTHQCLFRPGTNELFVCDLGMDTVFVYEQNPETGLLAEKERIVTTPGMGPRHIAFVSKDEFYLVGELDCHAAHYRLIDGEWRCLQRLSLLPAGFNTKNTSAAIRLHDGKLYVSNRGHDSVCVIDLDENGSMTYRCHLSSHGQAPRDFDFTPEGRLLFANQNGGGLVVDGGEALPLNGVVCVCLPHKL